jgi:membrane-associated protease RseP (regulator of RpoE activity)
MYHTPEQSVENTDNKIIHGDCFIERTRSWFWVIIIVLFGSIVYAAVTSSAQKSAHSADGQSSPKGGRFQAVALTRCPYCPGFLDTQGRCNVRGCPLYSPNRGRTSASAGVPVRRVLIKELALEVGASQGKGSVIIQSVYFGGNAAKAGLRIGDKIVRFNGRKVKDVNQFRVIVTRAKPESNVAVKVIRDGRTIKEFVAIGQGRMEGVTIPRR